MAVARAELGPSLASTAIARSAVIFGPRLELGGVVRLSHVSIIGRLSKTETHLLDHFRLTTPLVPKAPSLDTYSAQPIPQTVYRLDPHNLSIDRFIIAAKAEILTTNPDSSPASSSNQQIESADEGGGEGAAGGGALLEGLLPTEAGELLDQTATPPRSSASARGVSAISSKPDIRNFSRQSQLQQALSQVATQVNKEQQVSQVLASKLETARSRRATQTAEGIKNDSVNQRFQVDAFVSANRRSEIVRAARQLIQKGDGKVDLRKAVQIVRFTEDLTSGLAKEFKVEDGTIHTFSSGVALHGKVDISRVAIIASQEDEKNSPVSRGDNLATREVSQGEIAKVLGGTSEYLVNLAQGAVESSRRRVIQLSSQLEDLKREIALSRFDTLRRMV